MKQKRAYYIADTLAEAQVLHDEEVKARRIREALEKSREEVQKKKLDALKKASQLLQANTHNRINGWKKRKAKQSPSCK